MLIPLLTLVLLAKGLTAHPTDARQPAKPRKHAPAANVLTHYIDPKQQTALWFGARSHWLQPWRAYLDTLPAGRLRDAVGINLNVSPREAEAVCAHLARYGFRHARIEFGWSSVRWDDPTQLSAPAAFDALVGACRRHGIRPLFLLNSHHGVPCPIRMFTVRLIRPARKGDRTVAIDPADLKQCTAGRSGLSDLSGYWAAECLFTSMSSEGVCTLSRPLPKDLPVGPARAATLKYLPFYPSKIKGSGVTPPEYLETLQGWLDYVQAITTNAKRVLGTEGKADAGFDLEVWNELTFGSSFLSINNYYEKPIAEGDPAYAILDRTVEWVRDPAHGLPGVGVGDGFNNQWPWGAGETAPPGLAALDKHPYAGVHVYSPAKASPGGSRPVDALGRPDGVPLGQGRWKDGFTPSYVAHFPEYWLCGLQTEHLIRDVSPIVTEIYGTHHGRTTHPNFPDGRPAPAPVMWITEVNLDPNGADPGDLTDFLKTGRKPLAPGFTLADAAHMRAKAILRYLAAYVNKGVSRIYFFAAKDDNPMGLGLVSPDFFKAVAANQEALPPHDERFASPTLLAVGRMVRRLQGALKPEEVHPLTLERIEEPHPAVQFAGDPATAGRSPDPHPPLYNRDVLAFLPYQSAPKRYVAPVYVMTRNLARLYKPGATSNDLSRFDMPDETFRLTIGDLDLSSPSVSLYDPMQDRSLPVKILLRRGRSLTIELPLTDSPRLLILKQ